MNNIEGYSCSVDTFWYVVYSDLMDEVPEGHPDKLLQILKIIKALGIVGYGILRTWHPAYPTNGGVDPEDRPATEQWKVRVLPRPFARRLAAN